MDNVGGIWGMAQSTNCSVLIRACLPLLPTNIPFLLNLKLNAEQLEEALRLPSIKDKGGDYQLRLVASWMDTEPATTSHINPVDQLDSLLPVVNLSSITEASFMSIMRENHVIITSQETRFFLSTLLALNSNRCSESIIYTY